MPLTVQGRFLFGEFQVDPAQRIFQREGETVALNPRTFDLLFYLVSNAQRVVTKEELMNALWPDSRVEESNLTQHIFLLRKALTASESGEKIIVTVPGRGYQFTQNVTEIYPSEVDGSPRLILHAAETVTKVKVEEEEETEGPEVVEAVAVEVRDEEERESPKKDGTQTISQARSDASPEDGPEARSEGGSRQVLPKLTPLQMMLAAAVLLAVVAGGWIGWRALHHPHREALGIVLSDLQNTTGETQFDQALVTALAIDLGQSPYLSVTTGAKVYDTLTEMKRPPDAQLTPQLAREVCQRANDQAMLQSTISRFAKQYFITLQAIDCASGASLGQTKGLANSAEGVLPLLDRVAADLREQLGESGASVQRFSKPLFNARTGSFAALKAYSDASHLGLEGKTADSLPLFQLAIDLDPQFAVAYANLGTTYSNLGEISLAQANYKKAYDLRDTVGEQDRFYIIANYDEKVLGDIPASIANNRAWSAMYSHNPVPLANLANLENQIGKPELAIDPARQSIALNPKNATAYTVLARALMQSGRTEDAAATAKLAISRHMDETAIHAILFQLAYLGHDQDAMDEQVAWARGKQAEPEMEVQQGLRLFAQGRVKDAQFVFQTVVDGYKQQGLNEVAGRMQGGIPRIEAELGLTEAAYGLLQKLPDIEGSTDIPVAWAAVGEINRAEALLKREMDANPTSTLWQQVRGPEISAAIALNQGQPEAAIEALKTAVPYDGRTFDTSALRGRAYLGAKQPMLAEYEFLNILNRPGVDPLSYNYALAQLGLARALAQQGKIGKARIAYEHFFQMWQNADADLPKLKEARQEYGKLPPG
jgi:DNA-binding winged helix-turn-helix (wHTH) protein/tetratricopeptide (TPR) repeat protein